MGVKVGNKTETLKSCCSLKASRLGTRVPTEFDIQQDDTLF